VGIAVISLLSLSGGSNAGARLFDRATAAFMPSLAAQGSPNYTYTVITDLTNCFNVGNPVLNNAGDVAFVGNCGAPVGSPAGGVVVRRGNGGALTDIYTAEPTPSFGIPEPGISINDNGAVAFPGQAASPNGGVRYVILVGDGSSLSVAVDTDVHTQFKNLLRPSINNAGAVAFMAQTTTVGYDSVAVANGGSLVTIAGPGSVTSGIGVLTSAMEPALNDHGLVAFIGQGVSNYGLFTGNGGALTTISLDQPSSFSGLNDVGRAGFVANSGSVQIGDGGPVRVIAAPGLYSLFGSLAAINNASIVAFEAQLASGLTGVFIGPNPATDTVVRTGDVLPNLGTVIGAHISEEAINDHGQVAFFLHYRRDDDTIGRALVRADPVRVPTMTVLAPSPSAAVAGQRVTLTATVTAPAAVASGQIEFFEEATLLGSASLTNGVATLQTSALALGSHRLFAVFTGNNGFLPSISPVVQLTVGPQPPVQAPTGLRAWSIDGNTVTLRWETPPIGPAPTGFVLEGGIAPGQVLASIPTNSPYPIYTFSAPSGAFYVRVHAMAGAERSGPSNEIRLFVNTPAPPSPPAGLLGLVDGSSLSLSWRNTFEGGAPTALILDVGGALDTSVVMSVTDRFTYHGVPGGTYTFTVSAMNAAGTSVASNPVTLTFPGACSGAPLSPVGFLAYKVGNTISVVWDAAASGPAPTEYVLNVSGGFVGSFPTTGRTLSGAVGPGAYGLSVAATNSCGASPATPVQTISIP
jgi:hypothetical protein